MNNDTDQLRKIIAALEMALSDLMVAYDTHVGPGPSAYWRCRKARENANLVLNMVRNSRQYTWSKEIDNECT